MRPTRMRFRLIRLAPLAFVAACSADLPGTWSINDRPPSVYPDYIDVTIPCNIAPLTFVVEEHGDEFVTRFSANGDQVIRRGQAVLLSADEWRRLMKAANGSQVLVEVFARHGAQWQRFRPFAYHVAAEPIDPYLSYRLIAPSYVGYREMSINQRNVTSYEEKEIYNNMLVSTKEESQCVNCHSYRNFAPETMQFHVRQYKGGTVMVTGNRIRKINLKTSATISAGVYPAFHPTENLIAYSVNSTGQSFHTRDSEKVEVQDRQSDLILYDIGDNSVSIIEAQPDELETFPTWAPDGKSLYYVSAHVEVRTEGGLDRPLMESHKDIRYDLYRKSFDPGSRVFGPREKVYAASEQHKSITLPRVSPDGRYLLASVGDYGCFHIWHKSSDLYLVDLVNGKARNMEEVNSPDAESYHSWSSNGRWIVFSSRRDDGNYTRPYIAYFAADGQGRKPFVLPQADPTFYRQFYKSYNIPELMKESVRFRPQDFAKYVKQDPVDAKFRPR